MTARPDPNELITFRGAVMSRRDAAMVCVVERELGYELTIIKAHDVAALGTVSATTHNGLGVMDLAPYDWRRKLRVFKQFAATYHRTPEQGPWSEHIHLASFNTTGMDPLAKAQVTDYHALRNGLAGHAPDPNPWRHPDELVFDFDLWWRDGLLEQRIKGLRAKLHRTLDRISALRARRKNLRAQIAAAKKQQTYLH